MEDLARFVVQFVDSKGMASSTEIANRIRISGISKVKLSMFYVSSFVRC